MPFPLADFLRSGAIISVSHDRLLLGWGDPQFLSKEEISPFKPAFYFPDFFLQVRQPWIQYANWLEISTKDFANQFKAIDEPLACPWIIDDEPFKTSFKSLLELLQTNDLQKAVPYTFARSKAHMDEQRKKKSLRKCLDLLNQRKGHLHLYGYWSMSYGILGLTPEILFSKHRDQKNKVYTMALAGTCPSFYCKTSFLKDKKEKLEHQLVIEGICSSLKDLGVISVGKTQLLQLPNLMHLMTPIELTLNQLFHFEQLVYHLHPTPALGAIPIKNGMQWLQKFQEHTPRGYFGAPIGFQDIKNDISKCFVGIRNVQWNKEGMSIGAGCGVVKQSLFDKEWQEIQLKIQAVRNQFHL